MTSDLFTKEKIEKDYVEWVAEKAMKAVGGVSAVAVVVGLTSLYELAILDVGVVNLLLFRLPLWVQGILLVAVTIFGGVIVAAYVSR